MKVFEIEDKRFEITLELLQQGKSFEFSEVIFYLDKENKVLEIRIISSWLFQNLNEQRVFEEIIRGEKTYDFLITNHKKFAEIIKEYKLRFSVIEDSGNGTIEVCYLSDGKLIWR